MFETTIEKDLQLATTDAERESIFCKIYNKYRDEFLTFVEELKKSGIASALYNSSTQEETFSIWEKYYSENQELFAEIKVWAEGRADYFNTYEPVSIFKNEEELDSILEIGLMIFIVQDESVLSEEDINENFVEKLINLLKNNSNELLKAAGWYIECDGFETMTKENIFDFYSEE